MNGRSSLAIVDLPNLKGFEVDLNAIDCTGGQVGQPCKINGWKRLLKGERSPIYS
jgi:hypothetical protein